jgi:hypothetical protein
MEIGNKYFYLQNITALVSSHGPFWMAKKRKLYKKVLVTSCPRQKINVLICRYGQENFPSG